MKIVIFENEPNSVIGAFESANILEFDNNLEYVFHSSSQDENIARINQYEVIFVDITLAHKSTLDGYGLIKKIVEQDERLYSRIVILTGNHKVTDFLEKHGLDRKKLKIIIKPTDYLELTKIINDIKNN